MYIKHLCNYGIILNFNVDTHIALKAGVCMLTCDDGLRAQTC
jgi:hypothetical protein